MLARHLEKGERSLRKSDGRAPPFKEATASGLASSTRNSLNDRGSGLDGPCFVLCEGACAATKQLSRLYLRKAQPPFGFHGFHRA